MKTTEQRATIETQAVATRITSEGKHGDTAQRNFEICADGIPSLGRIKRRLRDLGVQTTRQTISQDLAALRLSNPRSPRQASRSRLVSSRDSRAKSRKGVQGLHIARKLDK